MNKAWKGYGMAVLATALAMLVRWPLWSLLGETVPFITFFAAITLSGWYGGLGPGLLTTLLCSLLSDWFFLAPQQSLDIADPGDAVRLLIFVLMGGAISWLTHQHHRAIHHLRDAIEGERQARLMAVGAVGRMAQLQEIAAAISRAATPAQVVEEVLTRGHKALETLGGAVMLLDPDGKAWAPFGTVGEMTAPGVSADMAKMVDEAIRRRRPVVRGVLVEPQDATGELRADVLDSSTADVAAALPLMVQKRVLGAMIWRFKASRLFTAEEIDFLRTLAVGCTQAIERAQLYENAQRVRQAAEMASRAKDEFLALLGHELRNPLAPMVTALEILRMRGHGQLGREEAVIARHVQHLSRMVDDLLDVSRISRGLVTLSRRPGELAPVLARALEMASPLLESRGHHVVVEVPRAGLCADMDPDRMAQVFANLLTNAAKYTPPGGRIWLTAANEGGEIGVRVRDTGMGMGPELLARVFDPFVQGAQGPDRSAGGLGIGLTLVKSLVTLHGGSVEAHSEGPGHGSEFVVHLPASSAVPQEASAWSSGTPEGAWSPPGQVQGQVQVQGRPEGLAPSGTPSPRVLVVDDNEDAAELLAEVLQLQGWTVAVALDGPQALTMLDQFQPEVAVLDIGLPVMDGYELAQRIRERLGPKAPRLVAVTGYGQERDRVRSQEAGFAHHLVKPVRVEELMAVIATPEPLRSAS
ncbi:MAG TPA: ATP-binding protein [Polyangia bacterium]|nr:ATP-binding protein [Polyangia bacterium]